LEEFSCLRLGGLKNDGFAVAASMPAGKSQVALCFFLEKVQNKVQFKYLGSHGKWE
jgi:hypothetical protein